ncbi:MAG: HesA/MoeB/ThiF family protein [Candidatus Binatia bacterium]|nr:HesA/MoeB/ThiF family protein [Candidatus Binatia bacterium]
MYAPRCLADARILIVGVGGLGSPAAQILAAHGAGQLTLVDPDTVSVSNLHRQLLFDEGDLGAPKAEVAARKLATRYPRVRIEPLPIALGDHNAATLIESHDWVIDATDGWNTKLWLHDLALACGRPIAHAGAVGWRGQALTALPGEPGCLRCVVNVSGTANETSCQQAGIIPGVVQLLGGRLALEAISWLSGRRESMLVRKLLYVDAYRATIRIVPFAPEPECVLCAGTGQLSAAMH